MNRKLRSTIELALFIIGIFAALWGITEANKAAPIENLFPKTSSSSTKTIEDEHPTLSTVIEERVSPNQSLALIIQPEAGLRPLIDMIDSAKQSVDLVMYSFNDPNISAALVRAKDRGVKVRVMLNAGYEADPSTKNEKTRDNLLARGVEVRWSPAYFLLTHQKTLIIDNATALVMTFNIDKTYYYNNRDFGMLNTDPIDVAAMSEVFDADWNQKKITPSDGHDLVWSPDSDEELIALIRSAKSSLTIYCQLMNDNAIEDALMDAARRGVAVNVLMTSSSQWFPAYEKLTAAGVHIRTFPDTKKAPVYIHAKVIIADEKLAYAGSINFSDASLRKNRELGMLISKEDIIASLLSTFQKDWTIATPYAGM